MKNETSTKIGTPFVTTGIALLSTVLWILPFSSSELSKFPANLYVLTYPIFPYVITVLARAVFRQHAAGNK